MRLQSMKRQNGAALAVGLILLLIITLMGYAGMKGTILQEKMAAGLHNRSLAHAGANSAVRAGETYLYDLVSNTNGVNVSGTPEGSLFNIYSNFEERGNQSSGINTRVEAFKKRNWTSSIGVSHSHDFSSASFNGSVQKRPEYIIEEMIVEGRGGKNSQEFGSGGSSGDSSKQKAFLVTGKGESGDGNTITLLQSMYTVMVDSSATN